MSARRASWVVAGLVLLGAAGCSAVLDWSDFSGAAGDAGGADAADAGADAIVSGDGATADGSPHVDATPPAHCQGGGLQCVTAPPAGWSGPLELFVAASGSAPACSAGFAAAPLFDGQGGLTAPAATCSACACGAPTGAGCTGPLMTFYVDDTCSATLGNPLTLSTSCAATPIGAFGATVSAPAVTGTCTATGGVATEPAVTWAQIARACGPETPPAPADCDAGQVCVLAPAAPFATQSCVMQPGAATTCPPEYPSGPQVFYTGVDDQRGCTACQCAGPSGGSCTISNPAIDACTPPGGSWSAPGTCTPITGPEPVHLTASPTLVDAGTCALAGGGAPSGQATGTGATSFCCTP